MSFLGGGIYASPRNIHTEGRNVWFGFPLSPDDLGSLASYEALQSMFPVAAGTYVRFYEVGNSPLPFPYSCTQIHSYTRPHDHFMNLCRARLVF